jgi:hypothetical protein
MKAIPAARSQSILPDHVHRRLDAYALAASAAGVGMLALAQPADAKIVYTPAHVVVGSHHPLRLDLNHDGIVDFAILNTFSPEFNYHTLFACQNARLSSGSRGFYICYGSTNMVRITDVQHKFEAAALTRGAKIQSRNNFAGSGLMGVVYYSFMSDTRWDGLWFNGGKGVKNRYLGLKFNIKGQIHFGWARLTVATTKHDFKATLTGYAYETVPGKGIIAGQTEGPFVPTDDDANSTSPQNTSLGALTAGTQARPQRRLQPSPQK